MTVAEDQVPSSKQVPLTGAARVAEPKGAGASLSIERSLTVSEPVHTIDKPAALLHASAFESITQPYLAAHIFTCSLLQVHSLQTFRSLQKSCFDPPWRLSWRPWTGVSYLRGPTQMTRFPTCRQ